MFLFFVFFLGEETSLHVCHRGPGWHAPSIPESLEGIYTGPTRKIKPRKIEFGQRLNGPQHLRGLHFESVLVYFFYFFFKHVNIFLNELHAKKIIIKNEINVKDKE